MCLGFSIADPQYPFGPSPGYFYPPLPYGPAPPVPPPFPYHHHNITTALRSASPFLLPQSPPYSGPVYSLPPPSPSTWTPSAPLSTTSASSASVATSCAQTP